MSYRLKRKRFDCTQCVREWNQLVGEDIETVNCDICETSSKVINHDVPTAKRGSGATLVTKIDPKQPEEQNETTPAKEKATATRSSFENNLRGAFSSERKKNPRANSNLAEQRLRQRAQAQDAYGLNQNEEEKRPDSRASQSNPATRQNRFQNGAYRMVFSDQKKTGTHNKLNLRDTSLEPSNIFGDANLPRSRGQQQRQRQEPDLNDRVDSHIPDDLPPLETAHVPHHQRAERARSNKSAAKQKAAEANQRQSRHDRRSSFHQAAAQIIQPKEQVSSPHNRDKPPAMQSQGAATASDSTGNTLQDRASRQGARKFERPDSGQSRRNIRTYGHAATMPTQSNESNPLAGMFSSRQISGLTDSTAATSTSIPAAGVNQEETKTTTAPPNVGGLPRMNAQTSSAAPARPASGRRNQAATEERKASSLPRLNRLSSEQVNSGASPFADILSQLSGILGQRGAPNSTQSTTGASAAQTSASAQGRQPNHGGISGINAAGGNANGVRARSTTIRVGGGNVMTVINIGVPSDHPLADQRSQAGPSGLHNVQIGGISVPAPQFVMMHRANSDGQTDSANIQNPLSTTENETQVGSHIESMVNNLLRNFMDVFNGREFLRMQMQYGSQFNPNNFMSNFNQNFASDDVFEQIRRLSEEEAQRRQRAKRAKKEAVERLPVIKIEEKHCKKKGGVKLEAPSCTICCDNIELQSNGMFMPCGHVYHPDCLKPWLEQNHTCPVCRFDLPLEEPDLAK